MLVLLTLHIILIIQNSKSQELNQIDLASEKVRFNSTTPMDRYDALKKCKELEGNFINSYFINSSDLRWIKNQLQSTDNLKFHRDIYLDNSLVIYLTQHLSFEYINFKLLILKIFNRT